MYNGSAKGVGQKVREKEGKGGRTEKKRIFASRSSRLIIKIPVHKTNCHENKTPEVVITHVYILHLILLTSLNDFCRKAPGGETEVHLGWILTHLHVWNKAFLDKKRILV